MRPLEVNYVVENQYTEPHNEGLPCGPDSSYPPGPTARGGITWKDPIDQNLLNIVIVDEMSKIKEVVQSGVQEYNPAPGEKQLTIKTMDIDGLASPKGIQLSAKEYFYDYNSIPVSAIIPANGSFNELIVTWSRMIRTFMNPGDMITPDVYLGGVLYDNLVLDEIDEDARTLRCHLKTKGFLAGENGYTFRVDTDAGNILRENYVSIRHTNTMSIDNYSSYESPKYMSSLVPVSANRRIQVFFNKQVAVPTNITCWILSGSSNQSMIIGLDGGGLQQVWELILSKPILKMDTLKLSFDNSKGDIVDEYNQPLDGLIKDADILNTSSYEVPNILEAQVVSAAKNILEVYFDREVSVPNISGWNLTNAGTLSIIAIISSGTLCKFMLSADLPDGVGAYIEYDGKGSTVDYEGQPLAAQPKIMIINNTYHDEPNIQLAYVSEMKPNEIIVIWNDMVTMSGIEGFSIGGDVNETITSYSISGAYIVFKLSNSIEKGKSVILSYNGGGSLYVGVNKVGAFDENVDNYSEITIPKVTTIESDNTGKIINVTFEDDVTYVNFEGFTLRRM